MIGDPRRELNSTLVLRPVAHGGPDVDVEVDELGRLEDPPRRVRGTQHVALRVTHGSASFLSAIT